MSGEGREMTLGEWVNQLPPIHSARREYEQLRERVAELERQVEQNYKMVQVLAKEKKQLRADSERLDFLEDPESCGGAYVDTLTGAHWIILDRKGAKVGRSEYIRRAIDQAEQLHRDQAQGGGEE